MGEGVTADLSGLRISIDARYLKRTGIGIPNYVRGLLGQLVLDKADVTLLTDDGGQAVTLAEEFPTFRCIALGVRSGIIWEQLMLPVHLARGHYDVHLAGANNGLPMVRARGTKYVLVVHDLIPLLFPRAYLTPRPAWAVKYLIASVVSMIRADHIIAVSQHTRRDVWRWFRRSSVSVLYPAVPARAEETELDRSDLPMSYFVYNGGNEWRKNFDILLEAFAGLVNELVADVSLVVLGRGYDAEVDRVRALGLSKRVLFLGYVSDEAKAGIIKGARALVYPSRYEGFGLPILEGMALGVPVVCGSGSSLDEVGGTAVIRVNVLDHRALADGMRRSLSVDRAAYAAMGYAQLDRLRGERSAANVGEVLREALGTCHGGSAGGYRSFATGSVRQAFAARRGSRLR
jgi:glycosyltransferase involved in cell wall biosynthesis